MDTHILQAFVAVADTQSFSKAAQILHLTQPGISKRIATLENQLGKPLFDRMGKTVDLTPAGNAFLPFARQILTQLDDGRNAIHQLEGEINGVLSLGTSHHVGLHRLPPILREYQTRYPNVSLDLHFLDSEEACHKVEDGELMLAVVTLPSLEQLNLISECIWIDQLCVVAATDHPLQMQASVEMAELANYPAILPSRGTVTRELLEEAFGEMAQSPHVALSTNFLETNKMLASVGLGWSVLPEGMIDSELLKINVPHLNLQRPLGFVRHKQRTLTNAARAMLELLHQAREKN